jgi:hypothetical protein
VSGSLVWPALAKCHPTGSLLSTRKCEYVPEALELRRSARPDVQYGGVWAGGKVFWYVRPSYQGRILIRGRRLDGPEWLRFNGRRLPPRELRIEVHETVVWQGQPPGSRGVPSSLRVPAPGCYAVQIDGTTFSRVVVFTVIMLS